MPTVDLAYEPVNEKPQNARLHQYMQGKLASYDVELNKKTSHIPATKKTVTLDLEDQYDSDNSQTTFRAMQEYGPTSKQSVHTLVPHTY